MVVFLTSSDSSFHAQQLYRGGFWKLFTFLEVVWVTLNFGSLCIEIKWCLCLSCPLLFCSLQYYVNVMSSICRTGGWCVAGGTVDRISKCPLGACSAVPYSGPAPPCPATSLFKGLMALEPSTFNFKAQFWEYTSYYSWSMAVFLFSLPENSCYWILLSHILKFLYVKWCY